MKIPRRTTERWAFGLALSSLLALSSCGGGGRDEVTNAVDYASFVRNQVTQPSDTAPPVDVNEIVFLNQDSEDPHLFDSLFDAGN